MVVTFDSEEKKEKLIKLMYCFRKSAVKKNSSIVRYSSLKFIGSHTNIEICWFIPFLWENSKYINNT